MKNPLATHSFWQFILSLCILGGVHSSVSEESRLRSLYSQGRYIESYIQGSDTQIEVHALNQGGINSKYHDFSPTVTKDHRLLVFNSNRPGGVGQTDLYYSNWNGSAWSEVVNMREVNSPAIDETPVLAPDGSYMIFSSNRKGSKMGSSDLYITHQKKGGWSPPNPLPGKVNSVYSEKAPSISPNGKYLLFTRYPKGNIRKAQIMLSVRQKDGSYDQPRSLRKPINIGAMEACPVFYPKGKGIFFSSFRDGRSWNIFWSPMGGQYGSDQKVIKLPAPVNSHALEAFFSITGDGKEIFFSRTVKEAGSQNMHYDIFRVKLDPVLKKATQKSQLQVVVRDKDNRNKLSADITASHKDQRWQYDDKTRVVLPSQKGKKWQLEVEKKGYFPFASEIEHNKDQVTVLLDKIEEGKRIVLPKIEFGFDKTQLTPKSHQQLDSVLRFLRNNPGLVIELAGHTDNQGRKSYNKKISLKRAQAVRRYLIQKGIDGDRLVVRGYGQSQPLKSNKDRKGRQQNRRTELRILKNKGTSID